MLQSGSLPGGSLIRALTFAADLTAKVVLIILLAAAASALLRRSAAATRHLIWLCALSATLLLPAASEIVPTRLTTYWTAPTLPAAALKIRRDADPTSVPVQSTADVPALPDGRDIPSAGDVREEASAVTNAVPWLGIFVAVYLVGVLAVLAQVAIGLLGVRQLSKESVAFPELSAPDSMLAELVGTLKIRRSICLRRHDDAVPMTWGWRRPVILVSPDAESWDAERLRVVLLHELAHIVRYDWPTQMLTHFVCAVYWFNPLVWWAAARMRAESESACDDRVLLAGVSSESYAQHLLEIAQSSCGKRKSRGVQFAMPMAGNSRLDERIRAILFRDHERSAKFGHGLMHIFPVACAVTVSLALIRPSFSQQTAGSLVAVVQTAPIKKNAVAHHLIDKEKSGFARVIRSTPPTTRGPIRFPAAKPSADRSSARNRMDSRKPSVRDGLPVTPMHRERTRKLQVSLKDKTTNAIVLADAEDISPLAAIQRTGDISNAAFLECPTNRLGARPINHGYVRTEKDGSLTREVISSVSVPSGKWSLEDQYVVDPAHLAASRSTKCLEANAVSGAELTYITYGSWVHSNTDGIRRYGISITETATANQHEIVLVDRFGKRHRPDVVALDAYFTLPNGAGPPRRTTIWIDESNLPFDDLRALEINYRPMFTMNVVTRSIDVETLQFQPEIEPSRAIHLRVSKDACR